MFGWFTERPRESDDIRPAPAPRDRSPLRTPLSDRPPDLRRTVTTAASAPHDVVLAELHSQFLELDMADQKLSAIPQEGESSTGTIVRGSENVYDPFTGGLIGVLAPGEQEDIRDEMWKHLAKIRHLQSEIAAMHLQMEGLGANERATRVEPSNDDGDPDNAEEIKAAKEAEFARLADRFTGKKETIDAIMEKLETLSQAMTAFHTLRNPVLNFASRSNPSNTTNTFNSRSMSNPPTSHLSSDASSVVSQAPLALDTGLLDNSAASMQSS